MIDADYQNSLVDFRQPGKVPTNALAAQAFTPLHLPNMTKEQGDETRKVRSRLTLSQIKVDEAGSIVITKKKKSGLTNVANIPNKLGYSSNQPPNVSGFVGAPIANNLSRGSLVSTKSYLSQIASKNQQEFIQQSGIFS